jgi:uncharacterized membrane protein YczE
MSVATATGAQADRLPRRLLNLYSGLVLFGLSIALMVHSGLGLNPWDVFHQGLAERTGWRFGLVVIGVSAIVLLRRTGWTGSATSPTTSPWTCT